MEITRVIKLKYMHLCNIFQNVYLINNKITIKSIKNKTFKMNTFRALSSNSWSIGETRLIKDRCHSSNRDQLINRWSSLSTNNRFKHYSRFLNNPNNRFSRWAATTHKKYLSIKICLPHNTKRNNTRHSINSQQSQYHKLKTIDLKKESM